MRVRAILFDVSGRLVLIKRVKPGLAPYWVFPGGGVEPNETQKKALERELSEELGNAKIDIIEKAVQLRHTLYGKRETHVFYLCRLLSNDKSKKHGPEFSTGYEKSHGKFIIQRIAPIKSSISRLDIKPIEIKLLLMENLQDFSRKAKIQKAGAK